MKSNKQRKSSKSGEGRVRTGTSDPTSTAPSDKDIVLTCAETLSPHEERQSLYPDIQGAVSSDTSCAPYFIGRHEYGTDYRELYPLPQENGVADEPSGLGTESRTGAYGQSSPAIGGHERIRSALQQFMDPTQ